MRAVIQRVTRAAVTVDDGIVGQIGPGLVVLLGITHADTVAEATWLAEKIVGLRIFADADGKMNQDVTDVNGSLLVISQFTLYGDAQKGRRPSFIASAAPDMAEPLYQRFIDAARLLGVKVETGRFGAAMRVELVNDGPVTLTLEKSPQS